MSTSAEQSKGKSVELPTDPRFLDLRGKRFGRLSVVEYMGNRKEHKWVCQCDCGNETIVSGGHLRSGHTKSCGCLHSNMLKKRNYKHGMHGTAEHRTWIAMLGRCTCSTNSAYNNYGGRGIDVCSRWRKSFLSFLKDMGPRPSPAHTIERMDNSIGYYPENCIWDTRHSQSRNKRNNILLTFQGKTMCLADWAIETGIPIEVLSRRNRKGWAVEKTLTLPVRACVRRKVAFRGQSLSLSEWSRNTGIGIATLRARLKSGWTVERALTVQPKYRASKPPA